MDAAAVQQQQFPTACVGCCRGQRGRRPPRSSPPLHTLTTRHTGPSSKHHSMTVSPNSSTPLNCTARARTAAQHTRTQELQCHSEHGTALRSHSPHSSHSHCVFALIPALYTLHALHPLCSRVTRFPCPNKRLKAVCNTVTHSNHQQSSVRHCSAPSLDCHPLHHTLAATVNTQHTTSVCSDTSICIQLHQ